MDRIYHILVFLGGIVVGAAVMYIVYPFIKK
jgi:hypothetical protein